MQQKHHIMFLLLHHTAGHPKRSMRFDNWHIIRPKMCCSAIQCWRLLAFMSSLIGLLKTLNTEVWLLCVLHCTASCVGRVQTNHFHPFSPHADIANQGWCDFSPSHFYWCLLLGPPSSRVDTSLQIINRRICCHFAFTESNRGQPLCNSSIHPVSRKITLDCGDTQVETFR